jgi:histidine triad (HIT) family protein
MTCLFCKIATGALMADIVYESDEVLAFRDINPQAPTHILIIPKQHISTLNETQADHKLLLGTMVFTAKEIAKKEGLSDSGYRLIFNVNQNGGQTVYHIHLHVIGGRPMTWPPG